MITKVGKNGAIPLPKDKDFSKENKLKIGDILLCTVMKDKRSIELKKFSNQLLTDEQIKAHGSLCRVEKLNQDDF
ncbi:bifunctional DNA-binding transcriptional regulator/antitoxin component of YhaV-PrlF toxin-antitoxin module [Pseudoalteromonas sp. MBR-15]|jgi:bifunctional DNA-binding transcriptional regulator/antitoxin component of YhaV-PrlF toxin-antitoxin module